MADRYGSQGGLAQPHEPSMGVTAASSSVTAGDQIAFISDGVSANQQYSPGLSAVFIEHHAQRPC